MDKQPSKQIDITLRQFVILASLQGSKDPNRDTIISRILDTQVKREIAAARAIGQEIRFNLAHGQLADSGLLLCALVPKAARDRIANELGENELAILRDMAQTTEGRSALASSALEWDSIGLVPPWEGRI